MIISIFIYLEELPLVILYDKPVLVNFLNCCLFEKVFISSSFLKDSFPGENILWLAGFYFHQFEYIILFSPACQVYSHKPNDILKGTSFL